MLEGRLPRRPEKQKGDACVALPIKSLIIYFN